MTGSDGSKWNQATGFHDSLRGVDCSPAYRMSDGIQHYLPTSMGTVGYFSDAGCAAKLVYVTGACAAPVWASEASVACQLVQYRVYSVGALHAGAIYNGTPGACYATTRPAGWTFYVAGAESPPSDWVAFN